MGRPKFTPAQRRQASITAKRTWAIRKRRRNTQILSKRLGTNSEKIRALKKLVATL